MLSIGQDWNRKGANAKIMDLFTIGDTYTIVTKQPLQKSMASQSYVSFAMNGSAVSEPGKRTVSITWITQTAFRRGAIL